MLKHRVVFAPAGSGKTQQLSDRYIALLAARVPPERILTLTFTEKAAAEMKERIFTELEKRDPALHRFLRENALKLRISTIHSFCLSLVRRFAPLLGLDPRVEVLSDTATAWESAKYDVLMQVAEQERGSSDYAGLIDLVTRNRTQGWTRLSELLDSLFARRVAVQRGKMVGFEAGLPDLAAQLRTSPIGRARFEGYSRLFPRELSGPSLEEVFRLLEERADVYRTGSGTPRIRGCNEEEQTWNQAMCRYRNLVATAVWENEFGQALGLFQQRFLAAYTEAKRASGFVDYDDMEYEAWKVLHEEDDWQNILRAFDEHTDHILVDEFQDTSYLQWGIIDKLTEEWRSGEGAKSELGIKPTIFLVGDEKQSIYMFRDAKVEVFAEAADKLEEWVGKNNLERETLEKNYRSLQAIIDFNNALFSHLMSLPSPQPPTPGPSPWRTRYAPFTRARKNTDPGRVELILVRSDENAPERRRLEATIIARRIRSLVQSPSADRQTPNAGFPPLQTATCDLRAPLTVYDRNPDPNGPEAARPCEYKDIAILIRSRTLLAPVEDALREFDIPFLVLGGSGFYEEREVRYLRSLLGFLVDPTDDVALYVTLRGPFFDIAERDLFLANSSSSLGQMPNAGVRTSDFALRTSHLRRAPSSRQFLWDRFQASTCPKAAEAMAALKGWLDRVHKEPLASIISRAMDERHVWTRFWEPQREANVRKFLAIIEDLEASGAHPLRILNALEQAGADEAKADVRVEDMPGVQILTVHAAKGLQFPVVFLPGLDATIRSAGSAGDKLVVEEASPDEVKVSYIPDSGIRREHPLHREYVEKEYEEEKRIFYVACTRARDALFLTGTWSERTLRKTRLEWLIQHLGLHETDSGFALEPPLSNVTCLTPADIPHMAPAPPAVRDRQSEHLRRIPPPSSLLRPPSIRSVTRNLPRDFQQHGEENVGIGEVIHKLLEGISNGTLTADREPLTAEISRLLRLNGLDTSLSANLQSAISNLQSEVSVWDIIRPQPDSFAELPVMYRDAGGTVQSGRIDRIIMTADEVRIYDYKTFSVNRKELPELAQAYYDSQLRFYEEAIHRLYPNKKVSSFLSFTALPIIIPAGR
jgi:ATP-dependent helicase/nuclease subunit A